MRGNPARETGSILKFLEISEIKDFEDDGAGGNFEDDNKKHIILSLFTYRHPRALRGDPAHEARSIPKFPEISEIKDFEDDGAGGDLEDAAVGRGFYYFV